MKKIKPVAFGKRLKEFREKIGISQEILAGKSGIRKEHIWALENGRREDPKLSTVIKICIGLDCGLDELILKTRC